MQNRLKAFLAHQVSLKKATKGTNSQKEELISAF
jgi:hypothetical protein